MKARSSPSSTKTKKPPLGYRVGRRLRSLGNFGRESVEQPSSVPRKAGGWFKRRAQKIWKVRGGGLYALGYIATFTWFEVRTLAGEIADSAGIGEFVSGQLVEFVTRVAVESLWNMLSALVWPLYIISWQPLYGSIALVLAYLGFARFMKRPIERWLFADDSTWAEKTKDTGKTPVDGGTK